MTADLQASLSEGCPLCHSPLSAVTGDAIAGQHLQCAGCGQSWTTRRLMTVAAYRQWCDQRHASPAFLSSAAVLPWPSPKPVY